MYMSNMLKSKEVFLALSFIFMLLSLYTVVAIIPGVIILLTLIIFFNV